MYCSNCLYKNEEGQSLCSKCGKKLKKHLSNKQLKSLESSITRRSIKKDAYHRQKDPLYIAYIIKVAIMIVVFLILKSIINPPHYSPSQDYNIVEYVMTIRVTFGTSQIFFLVLEIAAAICNLGLSKMALDISRDKKPSVTEIITYPFSNLRKLFKLLIIITIYSLVTSPFKQVPIFGTSIYFIIAIIVSPIISILPFVLIEEDNTSIRKLLKKTRKLLTKNVIAYYALRATFLGWQVLVILGSFLGWYLLAILESSSNWSLLLWIWILLTTMLVPYQTVAISNFYLSIKNEKKYNTTNTGLKNGTIALITAILISISIFIIIYTTILILLSSSMPIL